MPSREELKMLQALPLDVKVAKTKLRIKEFVEHYGEDDCYISFSGGKDSTVLLHIVRELYPNMKAIFSDTGLEYPEIKEFVRGFDNVEVVRPLMNFRQVIEKHGYPIVGKEVSQAVWEVKKSDGTSYSYRKRRLDGTLLDKNGELSAYNMPKYKPLVSAPFNISHKCCDEMKKKPINKLKKFGIIGDMATESQARKTAWMKRGCNSFDGKISSHPMSFWTEQDVLKYIKKNNIEICSVYGDVVNIDADGMIYDAIFDNENSGCKWQTTGCARTGCVFCGFGAHLEKGESRFQRLKRTHPKLYTYCINGQTVRKLA